MCDIDSSKTYLFWNRNPVQTSKHIVEVVFFGSEILLSEGQTVTRLLSCSQTLHHIFYLAAASELKLTTQRYPKSKTVKLHVVNVVALRDSV